MAMEVCCFNPFLLKFKPRKMEWLVQKSHGRSAAKMGTEGCSPNPFQPGDMLCHPHCALSSLKCQQELKMNLKSTVWPSINVPRNRFLDIFSLPKAAGVAKQAMKIRVSDILLLERSAAYSGGEQLIHSNLMKCSDQCLPVHEYKVVADSVMAIAWPCPRNAAVLLAQDALWCRAIFVSLDFYLCSEFIPIWEFDIVTHAFICK